MIGNCGLCKTEKPLQKSHYIPSAVYRIITRSDEKPSNAPVILDVPQGTALLTNRQACKHFLCAACEGRISRLGESAILSQCNQDAAHFPLRELLEKANHTLIRDGRRVYAESNLPDAIKSKAYLHFVASVVWRGSATRWLESTNGYFGALGVYEERIRQFLLGHAEFPGNYALVVQVDFEGFTRSLSYFPKRTRMHTNSGAVWRHSFVIPGIRFVLFLGGAAKTLALYGQTSFHEWHPTTTEFASDIASRVSLTKPKGMLAK